MRKFLIASVVLLIIFSAVYPWVNSNPIERVKIHGEFPFDKGYKLSFSMSAHTNSEVARFFCGGFGFFNGATGIDCSGGRKIVEPKIVGCCSYELEYFSDYYSGGILSWTISPVYYRVHYGDFDNVWGGAGLPNKEATIHCRKELVENGARYLACTAEENAPRYMSGAEQLNEKKIDFDVSAKTKLNRR